jgi:hypothetical protein
MFLDVGTTWCHAGKALGSDPRAYSAKAQFWGGTFWAWPQNSKNSVRFNMNIWVWINTYYIIPFLGDEHPFTSYFDVHQGYKVLTHCHI